MGISPGSLQVNSVQSTEGNSGLKYAVFTVTRTGGSGTDQIQYPVDVPYYTVDGTATAGSDYIATTGTVHFAGNQTTATISIPIIGDTVVESNETFFVRLGQVDGYVDGTPYGGGQGTILNDDPSGTQFGTPTFELAAFGESQQAGGWNDPYRYPREVADVNGDHKADILGFGNDGVFVSLAAANGQYGPATFEFAWFGASSAAGGWNNEDRYPRMLADVNGDGKADIVGFGEDGVFVALGTGDGHFGTPTFQLAGFGASAAAGGWNSESKYTRELADVNGDGKADIIGFSENGVFVSLATGGGKFSTPTFTSAVFGASSSTGGWNNEDRYPRMLADVNGDGKADVVGFGEDGVFVALGTGDGHFGAPTFELGEFGASSAAGGWTSQDLFPRMLGDVNGDGKTDIIGFASDGVHISYGMGNGTFQTSILDLQYYGAGSSAGGWTSESTYPRYVADTNGDGHADIIGLGSDGVYVSLSM